jgi:hypothetical protein
MSIRDYVPGICPHELPFQEPSTVATKSYRRSPIVYRATPLVGAGLRPARAYFKHYPDLAPARASPRFIQENP